MKGITYYVNHAITINIMIFVVDPDNEDSGDWQVVESNEVYTYQLMETIDEYLVRYLKVHYHMIDITFFADSCNVHLQEY